MDLALSVDVVDRRELALDSVAELTLAAADGGELPTWEPGAHIDLVLPSGLIRPYSLCGDPADHSAYRVAVLRDPESRGGSVEVHEKIQTGTRLEIRGPRNHFPLRPGQHTVLLAGGIGITPLLPMARQLRRQGAGFELCYGGRSRGAVAYVDELLTLDRDAVRLYSQDTDGLLPLDDIVASARPGCAIHACGPAPMLQALQAQVATRPDIALHIERFGPAGETPAPATGDSSFTVTLQRSCRTLPVPSGIRLIDVVRQVVPSVPFSCEEGYCGSCETAVIDGEPDHRDTVLSGDERAANDCMMICVGRSRSPVLVLDL
jgi:ferredoxin-NADP reductase